MATIKPTVTAVGVGNNAAQLVIWTPVTEADTCAAVSFPDLTDRSVHVYGTFGSASVAIQGSNNNGASFVALNDPGGSAIAITSEKIKAILENSQQIKPVATGGSAQSLSVAILFHLSQALRA